MESTRATPTVHALGFAGVAAALLLAAAVLPLDAPPLSLFACPLRAATGWPCLFCGCTHAFHHFVRGEVVDAFLSSPLGLLLAALSVAHLVATLSGRRLPVPRLVSPRAVILLSLAANWAFVAARARGLL